MHTGGESAFVSPHVVYTFADLDETEKNLVRSVVDKNLSEKMSSYLNKVIKHSSDVEIRFDITIHKNKRTTGGYDGSFLFFYSGQSSPVLYKREDFARLDDLVNHAFDHFKQHLSKM